MKHRSTNRPMHDAAMRVTSTPSRRAAWIAIALCLMLVQPASLAGADTLDEVKQAGSVGEQADGYLGALDPSAAMLVEEINSQRRAEYEKIAEKNGIPVEQVGVLAGAKLIRRTPTGQMVRDADGKWHRK